MKMHTQQTKPTKSYVKPPTLTAFTNDSRPFGLQDLTNDTPSMLKREAASKSRDYVARGHFEHKENNT